MSFTIGLSGINAANKQLDVAGNNIANVATVGFKSSRADFADVYSATLLQAGDKVAGNGVRLADVAQKFNQGVLKRTGNALDLGIQGNGFFVLSDNGSFSYTRAGAFKVNAESFLVDSDGRRLQGYGTNEVGTIIEGVPIDLKIDNSNLAPRATTRIEQTLNLNSAQRQPTLATFNASDPNTYNETITTPVYDAQGTRHILEQYYVKNPAANSWTVHSFIDGRNPSDPTQQPPEGLKAEITFNSNGTLDTLTAGAGWSKSGNTLIMAGWRPGMLINANPPTWGPNEAQAAEMPIAFDLSKTTSFAAPSARAMLSQNGYSSGQISGLVISAEGVLSAKFSNMQTKPIGQVAIARFANEQGLQPISGARWKETFASGLPGVNVPTSGAFGVIISNSLEESNVDLTNELVNLIKAQSNYQANAKTLSTQKTIFQTLIQIK